MAIKCQKKSKIKNLFHMILDFSGKKLLTKFGGKWSIWRAIKHFENLNWGSFSASFPIYRKRRKCVKTTYLWRLLTATVRSWEENEPILERPWLGLQHGRKKFFDPGTPPLALSIQKYHSKHQVKFILHFNHRVMLTRVCVYASMHFNYFWI